MQNCKYDQQKLNVDIDLKKITRFISTSTTHLSTHSFIFKNLNKSNFMHIFSYKEFGNYLIGLYKQIYIEKKVKREEGMMILRF